MGDFIFALEIIGTIAFAISGAVVGIEKEADIFGVVLLALTTAVGGGIIRDVLIGNFPPNSFKNEIFVTISIVVALVIFIALKLFKEHYLKYSQYFDSIVNVFDAIGLGIFTINGMNIAFNYYDKAFLALFVGVTTGVGGGIVRDVLINDVPFVLRKHVYAIAALIGGASYLVCLYVKLDKLTSIVIGVLIIFLIRMLATKFEWNLPKVRL